MKLEPLPSASLPGPYFPTPTPTHASQAPSLLSSRWRLAPPAPALHPAALLTCMPPSCTAHTAWGAA